MVRDVFIEEIVKKKKEPLDWLKIVAILLLCLGLAAGFLFLGMFFPFCWVLAGLSVYFGYFFYKQKFLLHHVSSQMYVHNLIEPQHIFSLYLKKH